MSHSFTGFPAELFEFYDGLRADNTRTYFTSHREMFDTYVAAPVQQLADALAPEFGPAKIFRPYRDVRFSKDKTPYKEHASFVCGSNDGGLYFQIDPDSIFVAGGRWQPEKAALQRFRELQDEPALTKELDALTAKLARAGFPLDGGGLKSAPRGWSKEHPRIELLRLTRLTVSARWDPAEWWETPEAFTRIRDAWRTIDTWNAWLGRRL